METRHVYEQTDRAVLIALHWAAAAPPHAQVAVTPAATPSVESGEINGAPFRIEIPPVWNRGLVIYAHGYRVAGDRGWAPDHPEAKAFRDVFLSRGFPFAESAYSAQGWAVKEGIEDSEALRRHAMQRIRRRSNISGSTRRPPDAPRIRSSRFIRRPTR